MSDSVRPHRWQPTGLALGFSRQEYWSGLPFLSPVNESEKWKWSHSVVSDSSWPRGLQPTRLLRPWDFPGKSTGVGCHCLLHWYILKQTNSSANGLVIDLSLKSPQKQTYRSGEPQCTALHANNSPWKHPSRPTSGISPPLIFALPSHILCRNCPEQSLTSSLLYPLSQRLNSHSWVCNQIVFLKQSI